MFVSCMHQIGNQPARWSAYIKSSLCGTLYSHLQVQLLDNNTFIQGSELYSNLQRIRQKMQSLTFTTAETAVVSAALCSPMLPNP